ncbi:hypothetical protein, partial [Escherichia coli]|uniref:hypothetical protein n=1 Tax=Escherichia coli TaxID=562 RepID=UPI001F212591
LLVQGVTSHREAVLTSSCGLLPKTEPSSAYPSVDQIVELTVAVIDAHSERTSVLIVHPRSTQL